MSDMGVHIGKSVIDVNTFNNSLSNSKDMFDTVVPISRSSL